MVSRLEARRQIDRWADVGGHVWCMSAAWLAHCVEGRSKVNRARLIEQRCAGTATASRAEGWTGFQGSRRSGSRVGQVRGQAGGLGDSDHRGVTA